MERDNIYANLSIKQGWELSMKLHRHKLKSLTRSTHRLKLTQHKSVTKLRPQSKSTTRLVKPVKVNRLKLDKSLLECEVKAHVLPSLSRLPDSSEGAEANYNSVRSLRANKPAALPSKRANAKVKQKVKTLTKRSMLTSASMKSREFKADLKKTTLHKSQVAEKTSKLASSMG
jgi:hypothetical protein